MNSPIQYKIIRRKEVLDRVKISKTTLALRISDGVFPTPISLGGRSVGFIQSEIDEAISYMVAGASREDLLNLVAKLKTYRKPNNSEGIMSSDVLAQFQKIDKNQKNIDDTWFNIRTNRDHVARKASREESEYWKSKGIHKVKYVIVKKNKNELSKIPFNSLEKFPQWEDLLSTYLDKNNIAVILNTVLSLMYEATTGYYHQSGNPDYKLSDNKSMKILQKALGISILKVIS